jgi:hypothetical protein
MTISVTCGKRICSGASGCRGSINFTSDDDNYVSTKLKEIDFPTWRDPLTAPCHTPMPATQKLVLQYPPGTGFVLAIFPAGFQVVPLYISASIVVLGQFGRGCSLAILSWVNSGGPRSQHDISQSDFISRSGDRAPDCVLSQSDDAKLRANGDEFSRSSSTCGHRRIIMNELPERGWRLEYYEVANPLTGHLLKEPIMTNGQCRVTTLKRPGPLGHHFRYEDTWRDSKVVFEFPAILVGGILSTTYQVALGHALTKHPEYWGGLPCDNELLNHLMSSIRQALCMLKSGYSDETRIKTVEFALSDWPHWKMLSGFQTSEIVR